MSWMAKKKAKPKKQKKRRNRIISIILLSSIVLIGGVFFYISRNFNHIISHKIYELYNQSETSNYYSLNFKKLRVNLINMSVRIYDINFEPNKEKQEDFFKKNGSIKIHIGKIILKDAGVLNFISSNEIDVGDFVVEHSKIKIYNQNTDFKPFAFIKKPDKKDSLELSANIRHIRFDDTQLEYFGGKHESAENNFREFGMEVDNIKLNIEPNTVNFTLERLVANLRKAQFHNSKTGNFNLERLQFGVSNLALAVVSTQFSLDYKNFLIQLIKPKYTSKDSLFTFSTDRILIDEKAKRLSIYNAIVHPNLNKDAFARHFKYQQLRPDLSIEKIEFANINYKQLIHREAILADTIYLLGINAKLHKDKRIPLNRSKYPKYLAGQIFGIKMPLNIHNAIVKDLNIDFSIQQKDGRLSRIDVTNIEGELKNIQNKTSDMKLYLNAMGRIHNSIPFRVHIQFDYDKNVFSYQGRVYKSNLAKLSKIIRSFAPVKINKGLIKSIQFEGHASNTDSRGKMLFLYKDLDLKIESNNAKKENGFQNKIFSIAANTYIYSNNPVKAGQSPRKVNYFVQRDPNKGFLHLLIQSLIQGIKETIVPSKENRKRYRKFRKNERNRK